MMKWTDVAANTIGPPNYFRGPELMMPSCRSPTSNEIARNVAGFQRMSDSN